LQLPVGTKVSSPWNVKTKLLENVPKLDISLVSTLTKSAVVVTMTRTMLSVHATRDLLRELLRETAQSVAVVTARLPDRARHPSTTPTYHGATLSSFTSIALDPLPLVAFSLRVPSRMASALHTHVAPAPASSPAPAHLIINILSAAQPHLADRFARPDLHPRPFADPHVHWTHSQDGLPILSGALGALSCRVVSSVPLAHLGESHARAFDDAPNGEGEGQGGGEGQVSQASAGTGLASELFIARVLRVEHVPLPEDDEHDAGLYKLPLLYHRRRYTTVGGPLLLERRVDIDTKK
jgi:flavin reductase (DIM6/NTAB) family NADH-FMN oxidoreductase RutF